ncbi:TPA: KxYKxGKxW signal peptide domain-containing protein [Candidatus Avigastranaerophilus faecigallinarum]|nr:KxYKxGKxW signal peptide domain-containing protein [Candidatus Avigastranaerophilus faecigallinarum]
MMLKKHFKLYKSGKQSILTRY